MSALNPHPDFHPNGTNMLDLMICRKMGYITSYSIWQNRYALAPTVILTSQLVIIHLTSKFVDYWLRQLGQTSIVSQIIAGILLGPSGLGQNEVAAITLFPPEGYMNLATFAALGNMFYHFLIAVRIDPMMVLKPGRAAMFIASVTFSVTMFFSILMALFLKSYMAMNDSMKNSIVLIGIAQAFTGNAVVSYFITELKIQNTDVGRLSLSVAVFSDVLNIIMVTLSFIAGDSIRNNYVLFVGAVLTTVGLAFVIVFGLRPVILDMISYIPIGKPADQKYVMFVIVSVLTLGFLSEVIGQHYLFGPEIFGMVVPEGPPLGAALVTRLDTFVSGFLYPTYLAISGLQTNFLQINTKEIAVFVIIVVFGIIIKTGAVMSAAMYMNVPAKNSFVLAMILSSKGILEITIYNFWKESKVYGSEEFTLCIVSVIVTTGILTPLVRLLYNPTKLCQPFQRLTIQHSNRDSNLRMLLCIHSSDNVPTLVNLLEMSNATEESPISVIALVLVELVGRSAPVLISNDKQMPQHYNEAIVSASKITSALKTYEQQSDGCTSIQSFTSISSFDMMHLDIFKLAIDKRTSILIMPFHKKWAIDGNIESVNARVQRLNCKVLEKSPCSVGILIDRGILKGSSSFVTPKIKFNVGVIFLGGPDDKESLAYGARMAKQESVILTVIRFLLFGSENSIERKRDTELIYHYKQANIGDERFLYVEEVVRDGVGLSKCIAKIVDYFDLILVGRYHEDSPLFVGLEEWSECPELGIIGDMIASPDFKTTASVLVVQQQRIRASKKEIRFDVDQEDISWGMSKDYNKIPV